MTEKPTKDPTPHSAEEAAFQRSRAAANLALARGASVIIDPGGGRRVIKPTEPLPDSPFRLFGIRMPQWPNGPQIKPPDMMTFLQASELEDLLLHTVKTCLNDEVCQKIGTMRHMKSLNLAKTNLNDAWLAHFAGLPALESLSINDTATSDRGLAHVAGITSLIKLSCANARVTAAGLASLPLLPHLKGLSVGNKGASASEIARAVVPAARSLVLLAIEGHLDASALDGINRMTELQTMNLANANVTGETLKKLAEAPGLWELKLTDCQVPDSAWAELPKLRKLSRLNLVNTARTPGLDAALKQFPKAPVVTLGRESSPFGDDSSLESDPPAPEPQPVQDAQFPPGQWVRYDPTATVQPITQVRQKADASLEDGWLTPSPQNQDVATFSAAARGRNWGVRATYLWASTGQARLGLRGSITPNSTDRYSFQIEALSSKATWQRIARTGREDRSPQVDLAPAVQLHIEPGQEVQIEAFAIGENLYARVNDRILVTVSDGTYSDGLFEISSTRMPMKNIEFINLDGINEAEALKAAGLRRE